MYTIQYQSSNRRHHCTDFTCPRNTTTNFLSLKPRHWHIHNIAYGMLNSPCWLPVHRITWLVCVFFQQISAFPHQTATGVWVNYIYSLLPYI